MLVELLENPGKNSQNNSRYNIIREVTPEEIPEGASGEIPKVRKSFRDSNKDIVLNSKRQPSTIPMIPKHSSSNPRKTPLGKPNSFGAILGGTSDGNTERTCRKSPGFFF